MSGEWRKYKFTFTTHLDVCATVHFFFYVIICVFVLWFLLHDFKLQINCYIFIPSGVSSAIFVTIEGCRQANTRLLDSGLLSFFFIYCKTSLQPCDVLVIKDG